MSRLITIEKNLQWQPMSTVPFNQYVICLWGTCTIGSSIFFSEYDVKVSYAKYWLPLPELPNEDGRNS